jgi:hypothetical protein
MRGFGRRVNAPDEIVRTFFWRVRNHAIASSFSPALFDALRCSIYFIAI